MELTVATGTYGSADWAKLARTRAWPSVVAEGLPWVHIHGIDLADARNRALKLVETEWVCFLDADDALGAGFAEAMSRATADVRVPMLSFVRGNRERPWQPRVFNHDHHDCVAECVTSGAGNWLPAGTVARTELVREVGGWREYPVFEDYDLWMRVLLTGASVELVREATYRAWVRPDSRNRGPSRELRNATHRAINEANLGRAVIAA